MGADMGADMLMLFKIGRMRRRTTRSGLPSAGRSPVRIPHHSRSGSDA